MSVALTLTFAQTQVFISMLCAMKHAIFVFYIPDGSLVLAEVCSLGSQQAAGRCSVQLNHM
jgi:hypothetical protein